MSWINGPEVLAELAPAQLEHTPFVPEHFVAGEDPATINQLRIHRGSRARATSLLFEMPLTVTVFALHEPARALSERTGARVAVWDTWPSVHAIEYLAGVESSRLDATDNCSWRGVPWFDIEQRTVDPPFPEELLPHLLGRRQLDKLVAALLDNAYGARSSETQLLATYHHPYTLAEAVPDLVVLFRAVFALAVATGRATIEGFGTLIAHGPMDFGWQTSPAVSELFDDAALTIDLDDWHDVLTTRERAAAHAALARALARVTVASDVVIPGVACFHLRQVAGYRGTNPRTGEPIELKPRTSFRIVFDPNARATLGYSAR